MKKLLKSGWKVSKTELNALNEKLEEVLFGKEESTMKETQCKDEKKNFKCEQCDDLFNTKGSLKDHRIRTHQSNTSHDENQTKPNDRYERYIPISKLKCDLCESRFRSLEFMDDHMDSEHGGRWKLFDPDVVKLGEDYTESSDGYSN